MRHDYAAGAVWIVVLRHRLTDFRVHQQAAQVWHEDIDYEAATLGEMPAHARHAGIEGVDIEKVPDRVPRDDDQGEATPEPRSSCSAGMPLPFMGTRAPQKISTCDRGRR